MTTCPLCGQRDHTGPCYADLREQWRQEECERFFKLHKWTVVKDVHTFEINEYMRITAAP